MFRLGAFLLTGWLLVSCSRERQSDALQKESNSTPLVSEANEFESEASEEFRGSETPKPAPVSAEPNVLRPSEIREQQAAKGNSPLSVHKTYNTEAWEGQSHEQLNDFLSQLEGWIAGMEEADEPHPNYRQFTQMRKELVAYLNEQSP